jgi:hypothetical protein
MKLNKRITENCNYNTEIARKKQQFLNEKKKLKFKVKIK